MISYRMHNVFFSICVYVLCVGCIDGIYGNVCNVNCSEFCKNKRCDRKTGACTDGCLAGYTGSRCDQSEFLFVY